MQKLAIDSDKYVRRSLANNPQIPESIQLVLAEDRGLNVQLELGGNDNLTSKARNRLIELGVLKSSVS